MLASPGNRQGGTMGQVEKMEEEEEWLRAER